MDFLKKTAYFLLFIMLLPIIIFSSSCADTGRNQFSNIMVFTSLRDIPNITVDEIRAIETLQREYDSFVYGMPLNTEAFINENGEVSGFSAFVCKWLTELFGIRFRPVLFEWFDLLEGLESGEIAFSGELTSTEARRQIYHMTSAIAHRPVKAFRLADSRPVWEITESRLLRAGFIQGAATINAVTAEMEPGTFDVIEISDFNFVYDALKNGEIDAFYYSGAAEISFIEYTDVIAQDFYPLIYMPVSLSTRNSALEPVISIVEKVLKNGGMRYLTMLYNQAHHDYLKYKLNSQLTEEEHAYIRNNPVVLVGVDPGNYPGCFYDRREKEWRGIFLDILDAVSLLTGLTFKRVNDEHTEWPEIYQMLADEKISLVPELTQTADWADQFIWPETEQLIDYYALISHNDFPDIKINEVLYVSVGLARNTAYAAIFKKWFPDHVNTVEYESMEEAYGALQRGEVDMIMGNQNRLLYLTHYLELPVYKTNIVFDFATNTKFGFNKEEVILCSIIDKVLGSIDSKSISDYWMRRTYDYRSKVADARTPWIIGAGVLFTLVLVLLVILFVRSRLTGKELEKLVQKRTIELKKMETSALAASKSKSVFLANMSHEIRTPMNAILGVTEILVQNERLPEEIKEGLNKIYSSCDLLLSIINDILDFSKIEAGKIDIMPVKYELASLINDSIQLNMMRIDSKPIEFILKVQENIPAKLIGDELRIKQILNNLLSNAFKYTDKGKVILSVESGAAPEKDKIILILSVRDTGSGMTQEQLNKLFEEYSRFNIEKNITVEGTGLGLAISRRLTNIMDGKINVESELNTGSCFTIRLPQGLVDDEVMSNEVIANLQQFHMSYASNRKSGQIVRDPMPYGKVLIVDDVETNIYVAVGLMKLYRLQIDYTMSGQEAIDKIKQGNVYDVIFMDHMMPGMDGIEATRQLRNLGYNESIVALTANAVSGQADIFLQNGFDYFISKPIDIRQLNSILNKLVRDKQPPDVIEACRQEAAKRQMTETKNGNAEHPQLDALLLESFIRDAQKAADLLEYLAKNSEIENRENLQKFTIVVHGIKSSLWNIGENELAETAGKLEISGRECNIDFIKSTASAFISNLRILLERLESKRDGYGSDEDIEDLQKKLKDIQEACADYDRKGALDILSKMINYSKETKAVLNNIMSYVNHSEFEAAENAAREYADLLNVQAGQKTSGRLLNNEITGLDITKGLERYNNDEETYIKVLRSYTASVRSLLSEMESVNENSISNYKIKVHGIKGTSLDICAENIGKSAADLENAAKTGDLDFINSNNPVFLEAAWTLVSGIDDMLIRLDAENPKPKKDKPDKGQLEKLLAACRNYEMDEADAAMYEIQKYQYESDDGLANWLQEAIDRMDFAQIVKKLSNLE
ncbi:MAG: ATP-binding protein [Treponema sp.]|nr:ATP-binding protein [Treponema sp.]